MIKFIVDVLAPFIFFRAIWILGGIILWMQLSWGLPETFFKIWIGFFISGILIIFPFFLIQIANPNQNFNEKRALTIAFVLGFFFWFLQY